MPLNGIRGFLIALIISVVLILGCRRKAEATNNTNALTLTNGQNMKITYASKAVAQYMTLVFALDKIKDSGAPDRMEKFVEGAWALIKDYPDRPNGYQDIMMAIGDYQFLGKPDQARALAKEMIDSSAPDDFKLWAKGLLYRLDSMGKPVEMKFTAIDGREVDLAKMKGKVVLVDFWGDNNELPQVKAAFEKFHAQGFEIIGIYNYMDKDRLEECIKTYDISWPQYFDDKQTNANVGNKLAVEFGIDGFPQMFLLDKEGRLRFDNVRARNNVHPKGDTTPFEEKISGLLAE